MGKVSDTSFLSFEQILGEYVEWVSMKKERKYLNICFSLFQGVFSSEIFTVKRLVCAGVR